MRLKQPLGVFLIIRKRKQVDVFIQEIPQKEEYFSPKHIDQYFNFYFVLA